MTYAKQLTKNMEWLWSFIIRGRAEFRCQLYGMDHIVCKGNLQAAHLVTRGVKGIKYDRRNGRCICEAHHVYYTHKPEFWSRIASELWATDWLALTKEKWQEPDTAIDKDATFVELFLEAQPFVDKFPEYKPKMLSIAAWTKKVTQ